MKKWLRKSIISRKKTKNYSQSKMNYNSIIMKYQKIMNLLENTQHQPGKFRTKNCVEAESSWLKDESHGMNNI